MSSRRMPRLVVFVILGAALSVPAAAQTVKRETAKRTATIEGIDTFRSYCAACHGARGAGNGPAASALKTPPADLTMLARKAGGTFSARDVEDAILGRNKVYISHGSSEMPVWGPILRAVDSSDRTVMMMRVSNLVDYIRTLQAK